MSRVYGRGRILSARFVWVSSLSDTQTCTFGFLFLDLEKVRSLSLGAISNLSEGTGLPWLGHHFKGHKGLSKRPTCSGTKESKPFTILFSSILFHSTPYYAILFYSILFYSILLKKLMHKKTSYAYVIQLKAFLWWVLYFKGCDIVRRIERVRCLMWWRPTALQLRDTFCERFEWYFILRSSFEVQRNATLMFNNQHLKFRHLYESVNTHYYGTCCKAPYWRRFA